MFSHSCQCCCRQAPTCSSISAASLARSVTAPRAATEESLRAKGTTRLRSRRVWNRRRRNQCKVSGTNGTTSLKVCPHWERESGQEQERETLIHAGNGGGHTGSSQRMASLRVEKQESKKRQQFTYHT
ncbi:hypothetical protein E2C01_073962 [Portunus trituberculatus]|uniref:Uncharacterized protein n=2 Tax=Portunus trituberculatus TaxID=210409 RepID=A0A5B7IFH3_PORTR|nr:hypothetical protein [Portunus trituberculatus]